MESFTEKVLGYSVDDLTKIWICDIFPRCTGRWRHEVGPAATEKADNKGRSPWNKKDETEKISRISPSAL
jgi:hypothetical protein